jgi:hypothetical protein
MKAPRPSVERADSDLAHLAHLAFRAEVARFRLAERRRLFPLGLHVGAPDGYRHSLEAAWPWPGSLDAGSRFDLAAGLVDALTTQWPVERPAWAWVTRPGVPELHDCDLGWYAATARAFGAYGLAIAGFRSVTRTGWLDVVSGESRTWKRLRS